MQTIDVYTYPDGKADQYSQDTIVSLLQPNGRFTDTYVGELIEGDQYYMPEKKLPMATDTEILDFMLDNDIGYSRSDSWVGLWNREDSSDITELTFDPSKTDVRAVFRELMSEVIHNRTL
jgi:hypothetical protein